MSVTVDERPISDAGVTDTVIPLLTTIAPPSPVFPASIEPLLSSPTPELLTEAEAALLEAMVGAPGASSAALGESLGIAASTVRKRQAAIREKFGGREGNLVTLARDCGIMPDGNTLTIGAVETEAS